MISTLNLLHRSILKYSFLFESMSKPSLEYQFIPALLYWILIHASIVTYCSLSTAIHPAVHWDPWPANNYKYLFASACLKITVLQWSVLDEVQESCAASSSQHSESGLRVQREIGQCQEADILIALWSTGKKTLSRGSFGSKDVFLENGN